MSARQEAMRRFGNVSGDNLYRRFHSLKTKAAQAKVPFQWETFDQFWEAFLTVAPKDYNSELYRFKFDLERKDLSGRRVGYALPTMSVCRKKESHNAKQESILSEERKHELDYVIALSCEITRMLLCNEYTNDFQLLVERAILTARQATNKEIQ